MTVIDLFAGPGGWDLAARELGVDPIGIEWSDIACQTRKAAGLQTWQGDVVAHFSALLEWARAGNPIRGLIASPPCPDFSLCRRTPGGGIEGESGRLVVQALRYAEALAPEWIAFEEVPRVLPIWKQYAEVLAELGYSTWTGVLNAANYGVPQTRRRAILLASRVRAVTEPAPTHAEAAADGLLPWVTLATALGWDAATVRSRCRPPGEIRSAEIAYGLSWDTWPLHRPASTVTSANRIAPPGYRKAGEQQFGTGAVQRLTTAEMGVLQSFPADYPWQGNLGEQRLQAGNAVPPGLALHVLAEASGLSLAHDLAVAA